MSINLRKGQKIDLTKGSRGLRRIMVGLGWDESTEGEEFDCDASVILCDDKSRAISKPSLVEGQITVSNEELAKGVVYFGNLSMFNGAIEHQGDNRTGGDDGDDEQIMVDLAGIPSYVQRLAFVVNIYLANDRNQHFGLIRNAYIRLVDLSNNSEICKFDLSDNYYGMQGLVAGEIYRYGNEWKFNAVGQPVKNASYLVNMVKCYL